MYGVGAVGPGGVSASAVALQERRVGVGGGGDGALFVEGWKKKKGPLPRFVEMGGSLAAEVREWQREQRWNRKGDKKPCWRVMMPNKLFGCPLRPEYLPGPTGGGGVQGGDGGGDGEG